MPLRVLRGESRYRFLAGALLAEIMLIPATSDAPWHGALLAVIHTAILVAAVFAISQSRRSLIIGMVLAAPALVRAWVIFAPGLTPNSIDAGGLALTAALYGYVAVLTLKDVFTTERVTTDTVIGGVCAYLLAGLMFAVLYMMVWIWNPGAFSIEMIEPNGSVATSRFVYLSFVTLTTLGYGDINPVDPRAQMLAVLESITGVLYLATFVSRLVSDRTRNV